jgi:iron complex transport system ATP-binding protein
MGPNGVGKSSLIRTLAGLQNPLTGKVVFGPQDAEADPMKVAVVLTDKITAASMTAGELIAYGRYPYLDWSVTMSSEDKWHIARAIEQVHIENILHKKLFELSDGQLQLVMVARALAQDTPVILLDEPTAHLDLNNRVEIMKLLRHLSRKMNKSILVATHELDLALQTADEIWLTECRSILTGIPEDLVLNGSFDRVFQFKGFDLKSGKIQHEVYQKKVIHIEGAGADYLWTKNAFERMGYHVIHSDVSTIHDELYVRVEVEETRPRWILKKQNRLYNLGSIAELIEHF